MIISNIRRKESEGTVELSADVTFESVKDHRKTVWFRLESNHPMTEIVGDPLLTGFLIPAMALGEDLRIEAAVTAETLRGAVARIQPILLRWHPRFRAPAIETAGEVEAPPLQSRGVMCGFSGGLDSWHTFIRNREEITHLLHCRGFDRFQSLTSQDYYQNMDQMTRTQARRFGKECVALESNLTDVACRGVNRALWLRRIPPIQGFQPTVYFGSQLVSLALLCRPFVHKFYIANSYPYDSVQKSGSTPLIDPLWTTSSLEVVHDGAECDRTDKIEYLAEHCPEVLNHLHVCHHINSTGGNCSHCEKCVRTRASLTILGLLDRFQSLESPLELDEIRKLSISPLTRTFWDDLLDSARKRNQTEIARAIEVPLRYRYDWNAMAEDTRQWWQNARKPGGLKRVRRSFRKNLRAKRAQVLRWI